jgi:hypothetical protein
MGHMNKIERTLHTPTPWEVKPIKDDSGANFGIKSIDNDGGWWIAEIVHPASTNEVEEANAQFIVHAVNNHQSLVDALEQLIKQIDNTGFIIACDCAEAATGMAKATLAAAKEIK